MNIPITEQDTTSSAINIQNPRTGETLYTITDPSTQEIAETYDRAAKAFAKIKALSVRQRLDEILKLKQYIIDNRETLVDMPIPFGILPVSQDEHALALDKVRMVGDPIVAVAALSEDEAEAAALVRPGGVQGPNRGFKADEPRPARSRWRL